MCESLQTNIQIVLTISSAVCNGHCIIVTNVRLYCPIMLIQWGNNQIQMLIPWSYEGVQIWFLPHSWAGASPSKGMFFILFKYCYAPTIINLLSAKNLWSNFQIQKKSYCLLQHWSVESKMFQCVCTSIVNDF